MRKRKKKDAKKPRVSKLTLIDATKLVRSRIRSDSTPGGPMEPATGLGLSEGVRKHILPVKPLAFPNARIAEDHQHQGQVREHEHRRQHGGLRTSLREVSAC